MKAKVDIRIAMPKLNLFRSRVEKPSKELTGQIRAALSRVISDIINENQLGIKAKFIAEVDKLNLTYKSEAHAAKVHSVVEDFFSVIAAPTQEELNALVGDDNDPEEAPAGETESAGEIEPAKEDKKEDFED